MSLVSFINLQLLNGFVKSRIMGENSEQTQKTYNCFRNGAQAEFALVKK